MSWKWYCLETERKDGLKDFLKCRTVGLCMAHNRLMNNHVVRSTRPVHYISPEFVPPRENRTPREPEHLEKFPDYPDPQFYLTHTSKYFFRHPDLHHLRIEQYNLYYTEKTAGTIDTLPTIEDTVDDQGVVVIPEPDHRHYDEFSETTPMGQRFFSDFAGADGVRRRQQTRLAVSRNAGLEPLGNEREAFYEQRLLLVLAWHCPENPVVHEDGKVEWHSRWAPPRPHQLRGGVVLPEKDHYLGRHHVSFEALCHEIDDELSSYQFGLVCSCCAGVLGEKKCKACAHAAIGLHRCANPNRGTDCLLWRRGSLFGGTLDIQRVLFNLHKKGLPAPTLRQKADEYVNNQQLATELADSIMHMIEQERDENGSRSDRSCQTHEGTAADGARGSRRKAEIRRSCWWRGRPTTRLRIYYQ